MTRFALRVGVADANKKQTENYFFLQKNFPNFFPRIEGAQGEAPKLLGRHFEVTDILVSKIDREGIELLKSWYKDEMRTSDWKLVVRLKKLLDII